MTVAAAVDLGDLRVCLSAERFFGRVVGVSGGDLLVDPLGRPRFLGGEGGGLGLSAVDLLGDPLGRPGGRLLG